MLYKYITFIAMVAIAAGIYAICQAVDARATMIRWRNIAKADTDFFRKNSDTWASMHIREKALNKLLVELLYDLMHTTTKQSMRWKFHILRELETILRDEDCANNDNLYDMIRQKLLEAKISDRSAMVERFKDAVQDYYLIDVEDSKPLVDLFRNVIAQSDRATMAERDMHIAMDDYINLVENVKVDFEVLDTHPLGDIPDPRIARATDESNLSREEMLERLIALADSIPPIENVEEPSDPEENAEHIEPEGVFETKDTFGGTFVIHDGVAIEEVKK